MTEVSPETRKILHQAIADAHQADRHDIDMTALTHLDEMQEDEAVEAIDDVYRQIMFDD